MWAESAACSGAYLDLFFNKRFITEAKRYCRECPVKDACREETDRIEKEHPLYYLYGVFGGETPRERMERRSGEDLKGKRGVW